MPKIGPEVTTPTRGRPRGAGAVTAKRLRDVAAGLFWTRGYGNTTIREIAEATGVQKASLYYHVDSKDALLFEICVESLNNITVSVEEAVRGAKNPTDELRRMIHAHLNSLLDDRYKHATMLTELKSLSPERRRSVVALRDDYESLIGSILQRSQDAGVIRPVPIKELRLGLLNLLNWSVFWYDPTGSMSIDYLAVSLGDLFLHGALISTA